MICYSFHVFGHASFANQPTVFATDTNTGVQPVNWRSYPECTLDENIKLVQGSPLGKGKLSGIRQSKIIQLGTFGRIATYSRPILHGILFMC